MAILRCESIFASLDPEVDNASVHFIMQADASVDGGAATANKVSQFWNVLGIGSVHVVGSYLSPVIDRSANACRIEVYDITAHLNGAPAGSPVGVFPFTLAAPSTLDVTPIPEGDCILLGYQSAYGTAVEFGPHTRPRARCRNRAYIGPINADALVANGVTHRCEIAPACATDVMGAFATLANPSDGTAIGWAVQWSPTNAAVAPIVGQWVDQRPAYQRTRARSNTVKLLGASIG